jgi:hypothetical protein
VYTYGYNTGNLHIFSENTDNLDIIRKIIDNYRAAGYYLVKERSVEFLKRKPKD